MDEKETKAKRKRVFHDKKFWTDEEVNELMEGFFPKNRTERAIRQFCSRNKIKNPGKKNAKKKRRSKNEQKHEEEDTMTIVMKKSRERLKSSIRRMCGNAK